MKLNIVYFTLFLCLSNDKITIKPDGDWVRGLNIRDFEGIPAKC